MSFLGIELNDAALTGATSAGVVFSEPGSALVENGHAQFGAAAQQAACLQPRLFNDRYWSELSDKPLIGAAAELQTAADLVHAQLKQLWASAANGVEQVAFAVPSAWTTEQLGLLLGVSEELGIPLQGITRLPVAATRRPYPDYELLHIEAGLHTVSVSRMLAGEAAIAAEPETVDGTGLARLRAVTLQYFARCFLQDSRFDPLQDAASEQQLYDQLDEWLRLLNKSESVELSFEWHGNTYTAQTNVAGLTEALRECCQPLIQALRSLVSIEQASALQIDARLAEFPGIVALLLELPASDVFVLEAGAAARGLVARQDQFSNANGSYSLTKSLPLDQAAAVASAQSAAAPSVSLPTHVLFEGTAYRITSQPFLIGAEISAADYGVIVPARYSGVSRQHCSIELSEGRVRLNDHSRYGTLLNGRKIDASAVLQPGDVVSVGNPACDFRLIAERGPNGS